MPALPDFSVTPLGVDVVASGQASCLSVWEALTRGACQAQAARHLEPALADHVHALWVVEALLDGPVLRERPDDCLAALVVSHHNLADLYRLRGRLLPAVEHTCAPHELLLRLAAEAPAAVTPAVRDAAWHHLRQTRGALLAWQRDHGAHPRIDECVQLWPESTDHARPAYRH